MGRLVDLIVAEIGSAKTSVSAFNGMSSGQPLFVGQGIAPSSIATGDVQKGLQAAIAELEAKIHDRVAYGEMRAVSSAAGGLMMTVHGLVYDTTVKAAQEAALGAGAVVKYLTAGDLTEDDLLMIRRQRPDIVLLMGGVDHGDKAVVIANARAIAGTGLKMPVVYAGNIDAREQVAAVLGEAGIEVIFATNVSPALDELNVAPVRKIIIDAFEKHVLEAPGMEKIREMVGGAIIPTPAAMMASAEALYQDIGDLMIVDVGGATTDVYSITGGLAARPQVKRTVEGDLGVYVNTHNILERMSRDELMEELGFDPVPVLKKWKAIPGLPEEIALLERLTREAVLQAVRRHAGRVKKAYDVPGQPSVVEGSDLTGVRWIIGTGGPLTMQRAGVDILADIQEQKRGAELYPKTAKIAIDTEYIMAACGALMTDHRHAALAVLKRSLGV